MILSHRHRFVFVKGRKVAGTSIEMLLSRICGPDDVVTPVMGVDERARIALGGEARNYSHDPRLEAAYRQLVLSSPPEELARLKMPHGPWYNHMSFAEIVTLAGPLAGYRVIAAERSPYAKLLSWLNMQQAEDEYREGGPMRGDPRRFEWQLDKLLAMGKADGVRNIGLYAGAPALELLRYETLQRDVDALGASLGVELGELPHAKRGLMSDTLDPAALLRRDQLDAINALYAEEFAAFGYPML